MHNNITLIAYENLEGGMQPLPSLDRGAQLPVLPETPPEQLPSEIEYIAGKSFISFGLMIAAILLVGLILIIVKKRKGNNNIEESPKEIDKTVETETEEDTPKSEETSIPIQSSQLQQKPKKNRLSKLSTPNNIQNCIKKFLEITK